MAIEIVPAILRKSYEKIVEDWNKVVDAVEHIQIDITDGIFAGDGTYRDIRRFRELPQANKIELHLMVHTPSHFVDDVIDLNPARCVFHIEAFSGTHDLQHSYQTLRSKTQAQLALAINPDTPTHYLTEHLELLDYVLFMGYNPGWANQPINPIVYNKIREFKAQQHHLPVAVDGHVGKDTIPDYVAAGATILCANTSIFGEGDPLENIKQLDLLSRSI